jgi:glutamate/tyrosine decarboxylase-like PLP-dependent enzyme
MAPVQLNIVCFRYRAAESCQDSCKVNREIVADLHESGIAAPSTTVLDGELAIRAAIVNHRTDIQDIDALISAVLEFGAQRTNSNGRVLDVERSPPLAM